MASPINLLIGAFDGSVVDEATADRMRRGMPGVTLFRESNVTTLDEFATLTTSLHELAGDLPALIAVDQEAGQLQTLSGIVTDFPGNLAMAATGDVDLVARVGRAIGLELRAVGVTVNYAPVCDLLVHATNHGLSIRSFGDNPRRAAELAVAMITGMQDVGVAATAKHFPGKGAAEFDTHFSHAAIRRTRAEFDEYELVSFRAAIAAGVQLMMTSHAATPALTGGSELPCTRSHAVLTGLLRDELGFDGVTITDALDMAAVGDGDAASSSESLEAVRAGADLLLLTPKMDHESLVAEVAQAMVASDASIVDRSAARVDSLRRHLAGFEVPPMSVLRCAEHSAIAHEVASRSLTELLPGRAAPISSGAVVIEPARINLTPADTTVDSAATLAGFLGAAGTQARSVAVSHTPASDEIDAAVQAARSADTVVVVTAAATEPDQAELVRRVAQSSGRTTVIVARNPLDADYLDLADVDRVLFSYGLTESTAGALANLLIAGTEGPGTLPLSALQRR